MPELAIIIPAFKKKYFHQALGSLACQTNKNFKVYIGDDNSKEDLKVIVDAFIDDLDIKYHRFNENLGSKNLIDQWARCVGLSENEPWIWLFSDDDIADKDCVSNFFSTANNDKYTLDVYRFNTRIIDAQGNIKAYAPIGPDFESCEDLAYNLLIGKRGNSMPDHIFSRQVYEETGGFVNTRFGQGADWATSIKFARKKGIKIIPNAFVHWRQSGSNLSSMAANRKNKMIYGFFEFTDWILDYFTYLNQSGDNVKYKQIKGAALQNLISVFTGHYKGVSLSTFYHTVNYLRKKFDLSLIEALKTVLVININAKDS